MQSARIAKSSRSAVLFLLLGIVSVTATVGGAWLYLGPEPAPPPPPPPKPVPVVLMAANDLNVGRLITASDIVWSPVKNGSVLSTHMLKGKTDESQVIGSVVRRSLFKGMPLNWSVIVRPGEHGFLAAALRPDHRAVTILVDRATSEAALIYPGDHVDVILTAQVRDPSSQEQNTVTATILENIRVVAVNRQVESSSLGAGRSRQASRNAASTVTLELMPPDAERLVLATTKGNISLAMRSLTDIRRRESRTPTAFENLLTLSSGEPEPESAPEGVPAQAVTSAPAPAEPAEITVKVFRGGKRDEVTLKK